MKMTDHHGVAGERTEASEPAIVELTGAVLEAVSGGFVGALPRVAFSFQCSGNLYLDGSSARGMTCRY